MMKIKTDQVNEVVEALERGEIIAYPTETSYGVGCDATNELAVARLFGLKGRPNSKGTTVLIPDIESVTNYIQVSDKAKKLMEKHWPGALNIIAPIARRSPIAKQCSQEGNQSVRISSHPFVAEMVGLFDRPIVSSSANFAGEPDVYSADEVELEVDLIVDGGEIEKRLSSTNIKVIGEDVSVLRQGEIKL